MKIHLFFFSLFIFFVVQISAQKIEKPTFTSQKPTVDQMNLINRGIQLHDHNSFGEAIALYRQVLKENPDCTQAMYELSYSLFSSGQTEQALQTALQGTKYKAAELPLFYQSIANYLDDAGAPDKAVKIYLDGIKILENERSYPVGLSSLYYNLGISYYRQKKIKEAREIFKKSVSHNFAYPSPNYLLATLFADNGYRIPSLLAATRLISLEVGTDRTTLSIKIFNNALLGGAKKSPNSNDITIFFDPNEPKDEGDFSGSSLLLGLIGATVPDAKENKNLSEDEIYIKKIDTLIDLVTSDKKNQNTFVGKTYFPFLRALKSQGYTPILGRLILEQTGSRTAHQWILENNGKVIDFLKWSKTFQPV